MMLLRTSPEAASWVDIAVDRKGNVVLAYELVGGECEVEAWDSTLKYRRKTYWSPGRGNRGRNSGRADRLEAQAMTVSNTTGAIFMSDMETRKVLMLDRQGGLRSFSATGLDEGFISPYIRSIPDYSRYMVPDAEPGIDWSVLFKPQRTFCLALARDDSEIFVTDSHGGRVVIFALPDGRLLRTINLRIDHNHFSRAPLDIAVDPTTGHLLVITRDPTDTSVLVLTPEGNLVRTFGSKGNGQGQFNAPASIACDVRGNAFVVDVGHHNVLMFDAEGRFVQYLAVPVHARPKRVTTAPDGKTVYVASVGLVYAFLLLLEQ